MKFTIQDAATHMDSSGKAGLVNLRLPPDLQYQNSGLDRNEHHRQRTHRQAHTREPMDTLPHFKSQAHTKPGQGEDLTSVRSHLSLAHSMRLRMISARSTQEAAS